MKILVIDDHALVREGLSQVLKGLDPLVQVLQAGNCAQGFALADQHQDLDLVLLDYHLPDMTGLVALDVFGKQHPELPVLVLSGSVNGQMMHHVLKAGAAGFVTKSSLSDELLQAVKSVLRGDVYLKQSTTPSGPSEHLRDVDVRPQLTRRQELVLQQLLDGRSNKEISQSLSVSEETVKTHVAAILRHFDVQNRTQAVVAAARSGYASLSGDSSWVSLPH
ncbi:response regulator [Rhodoferax aquaticus]|uniref:Response regulator transcription factor n=1 Tax=Rhodoferax aquaticus TaxID=2527691 RepID=A0A515EQA8_9BURK|nr:response regulator transcription factor [Rhodoferax aquaticus]QDL54861.1 response regulator transcription factor [Rhodoferax aquaticus]